MTSDLIIIWSILIGYVTITLIVANYMIRKKVGSSHFLVAGRSLPMVLVFVLILGDWLGGGSTVGVGQRGYNSGIVGILYPLSIAVALFVFAFLMSRRYQRSRAITVPEIINKMFDSRSRMIASSFIGLAYFIIGITQITSGGALLTALLGIDKPIADFAVMMVFVLITLFGGLSSVAIVNFIQVFVIFIGMTIALIFSLKSVGGGSVFGGFAALRTNLPPSYWKIDMGIGQIFGEVLAVVISCFAAQAAITGVFAARDEKSSIKASLFAGLLILPVGFIFVLIGMCARLYFADTLPGGLTATPAMMVSLSPIVAGISLCGVFAAIISTGPLCFLATTQVFVNDIYCNLINKNASDTQIMKMSRLSTIVLLVAGWLMSVFMVNVLSSILWAFSLRGGIAVLLITVVVVGPKKLSETGAFYGLIIGFITLAGWTLLGNPFGINETIPMCIVITVSSLLISKKYPRKKELDPDFHRAFFYKGRFKLAPDTAEL